MSLPVDRDQRRTEVTQAAFEIVADSGLDRLTVRNVALARGCSTAVVSHYFADKRDLLIAVYRYTADTTFAHWASVEAAGGSLQDLMASALPLDRERQRLWRVNLAYWSVAALDPALAAIQNDLLDRAAANIARALAQDPLAGHGPALARQQLGRQLLSLVMGIATQASFATIDWPAERQKSDLFAALERLLTLNPERPTHP